MADVIMVAPATANVIAKLAHGLADDMLTTTILASKAPKLIAPAMNTAMYENPITQDNLKRLQSYGMEVITRQADVSLVVTRSRKNAGAGYFASIYLQNMCMRKRYDRYESTNHSRTYPGGN